MEQERPKSGGPSGGGDRVIPTRGGSRSDIAELATIVSAIDPAALDVDVELTTDPRFAQRYVHRDLLGEGGMGEVGLYRDRAIGRDVAIKRIKAQLRSGVALARFVREARVQGQLEHPAIVPVYDLGKAEDGAAFFTMKRVHGASLDAILDELARGDAATTERFGLHKLLHAFSTVCLAVDFAHKRGVLHRDLKPSNVMLGEFGEVYVLDWGLARAFGEDTAEEARGDASREAGEEAARGGGEDPVAPSEARVVGLDSAPGSETIAGTILGTPGYMSPEQCRGEVDQLGPASDVYALGCILFRILHLEELHAAKSAAGRLTSTVTGSALDPSRALSADVPPELDRIWREAVALEAKDRIPSARALAEQLDRYLDGERDEARRRALATEHVERAQSIDASTPAGRSSKMRELGRALALDPTHGGALRELSRALGELPREIPPEALSRIEQARAERRGQTVRASAVRLVIWCAFIPFFLLLGVTSVGRMGFIVACLLFAAAAAVFAWKTERRSQGWILALLVASTSVIGLVSAAFGPFVLVPSLASTNAIFFAMSSAPSTRRWVLVASLLTILLPLALSLVGWDIPYYTFEGGSMIVSSSVVELPRVTSLVLLTVASVALVVVATVLGGRVQDELARAEEHRILHAHYLGQLVPGSETVEPPLAPRRSGPQERGHD